MIPLRKIMERYAGKVLYVDFWASWCGPCRHNMKNSANARQYLKEQKVEALYFSVDTEVDMWKKAIEEEGISNNQYLLSEDWKSSLCKFFQIQGIPHYVLFDKQHKIFMQNAPRPTDEGFEQLKSVVEKCK